MYETAPYCRDKKSNGALSLIDSNWSTIEWRVISIGKTKELTYELFRIRAPSCQSILFCRKMAHPSTFPHTRAPNSTASWSSRTHAALAFVPLLSTRRSAAGVVSPIASWAKGRLFVTTREFMKIDSSTIYRVRLAFAVRSKSTKSVWREACSIYSPTNSSASHMTRPPRYHFLQRTLRG